MNKVHFVKKDFIYYTVIVYVIVSLINPSVRLDLRNFPIKQRSDLIRNHSMNFRLTFRGLVFSVTTFEIKVTFNDPG